MTNAVAEKVDYTDPAFPPEVQMEHRNRQPQVFDIKEVFVSPFDDNDHGGVGA